MAKSVFEHTDRGETVSSTTESGEHFLESLGADLPRACPDRKSGFNLKRTEEPSARLYQELTELRHEEYSVYRCTGRSNRFLVVPRDYVIARHEPGHERAYQAQLSSCTTLDPVSRSAGDVCFTAFLIPDLSLSRRRGLEESLRRRYHPSAELEFPSELPAGMTCHWKFPTMAPGEESPRVGTLRSGQGLRVTISAKHERRTELMRMLREGDISAQVCFQLEDGTSLSSDLHLVENRLGGPWLGGPLEESRQGTTLVLTNRIERPVWIWEVLVGSEIDPTRIFSIGERLSPGETLQVDGVPSSQSVFPVFEVHAQAAAVSHVPLAEMRTVYFVNSANLTALGAECLMIESRIEGLDDAPSAALSQNVAVVEVEYTLPVQMASEEVILEYRVSSWNEDGEIEQGHWQQRQLLGCGNIVEIAMSTVRS